MYMYIYTGLFYIFIGFITVDADVNMVSTKTASPLSSLQNIVGIIMMVVGTVYFCLGMCLVQVIEQSRMEILRVREAYTTVVNDNDTEAAV